MAPFCGIPDARETNLKASSVSCLDIFQGIMMCLNLAWSFMSWTTTARKDQNNIKTAKAMLYTIRRCWNVGNPQNKSCHSCTFHDSPTCVSRNHFLLPVFHGFRWGGFNACPNKRSIKKVPYVPLPPVGSQNQHLILYNALYEFALITFWWRVGDENVTRNMWIKHHTFF